MKFVKLADARAQIEELLRQVERGETVVITRGGGMPPAQRDRADPNSWKEWYQAMRDLTDLKKGAGIVSIDDLLQWREEARKAARKQAPQTTRWM